MSGFNEGLKNHLLTGVTTTCRCWAVTRTDGIVLGFTDHDCGLAFGGVKFRADTRLSALALQQSTGLSVDNSSAQGALSDAALREAGLGDCSMALVAMGSDLESSILSAINLKLLGVETIWAKAKTKTHHRILSKLGVDRVIHPEVEVGQHIAQVIHNPLVRDYVSLGNGYHVVNFRIPEALEGKSLETLSYGKKFDLRCLGVMRGTEYIGRDGLDCTLQRDDLLILLGQRTDLRSFAASL